MSATYSSILSPAGKAAHIVKIIVTMHEWLFEPEPEPEAEAEAAPATADGANDGNSEVAVVPGSTESLATTAEPIASGPAPAEVREEEDDVEELASPDLEAAVQMPSGIVSHSVTESDAEAPSQNQSARSDLSSEQRPMQVEAAQASTELERKSISETSETSVEVKNSKDRARAFETPQLLETAPSSDGHGMNTSNHGIVTESLSVADASAAGQALARPRRAREGVRDSVYSAYSVYVDALDDSLALERIGRTRLATAQEADESDDAA